MENIVKFETISQYNDFNNAETLHPLISVIDFSKAHERADILPVEANKKTTNELLEDWELCAKREMPKSIEPLE